MQKSWVSFAPGVRLWCTPLSPSSFLVSGKHLRERLIAESSILPSRVEIFLEWLLIDSPESPGTAKIFRARVTIPRHHRAPGSAIGSFLERERPLRNFIVSKRLFSHRPTVPVLAIKRQLQVAPATRVRLKGKRGKMHAYQLLQLTRPRADYARCLMRWSYTPRSRTHIFRHYTGSITNELLLYPFMPTFPYRVKLIPDFRSLFTICI